MLDLTLVILKVSIILICENTNLNTVVMHFIVHYMIKLYNHVDNYDGLAADNLMNIYCTSKN